MAATQEPRSGIYSNFDPGESGWNDEMNTSLYRIGRLAFHLAVKDRDLATPPGSPANGDSYIIAASPTGAWTGHAGKIAVWNTDPATDLWEIYTPREGYVAWIDDENVMVAHDGSAWSTGITLTEVADAAQAVVTLGNADNEIGVLTISAAYSQAEVTALRDKAEELADDVRNLSTLVHALRTALIATGQIKGSA